MVTEANKLLGQRLSALSQGDNHLLLRFIRRGIEKESLRVTTDGHLAQTPHPEALGSALAHPNITTDYSEALLEFITDPGTELDGTLAQLQAIHQYVYAHIGEELLWASSMPCILANENEIPVARYGSSNVARMKSIYRVGLGHRYSRLMQTIAGIHYNFSLDDAFWEWLRASTASSLELRDYKTEQYFALIRNFHRYSWLLVYLFGASPAVCRSFVAGREHSLQALTRGTLYLPYATSLRMGDLGYQSDAQSAIDIPYNSLDDYTDALERAITTEHPDYAHLGTRRGDEWLQLNTSLLQIENEFYAPVRPKRVTRSGEAPRRALQNRGVEYIEVRCLDIDPFVPCGIDIATSRFIDAFLLYCLLGDSPPSDATARTRARENLRLVVNSGRQPGLKLRETLGREVELRSWGLSMLRDIAAIAELLDASRDGSQYRESVLQQQCKLEDPAHTPSARILEELARNESSFYEFAMLRSREHRDHFLANPLDEQLERGFVELAEQSLRQQLETERSDSISFEDYLQNYYSQ